MSKDILLTDLTDGVFTITLNRPKANAFNDELIDAAKAAFMQAKRDNAVRSVLLTATGKLFSAGQELKDLNVELFSLRKHIIRTYNPLVLQIRRLEKPVLVALNGAVAGAALGIVLACDMRIASEKTRFLVGFGGIGLATDAGVSLLLPAVIGLGRAAEAAFFNTPITADRALEWGLVNKVVPHDQLMTEAGAWASKLAAGPVNAIGLTKRQFNKSLLYNLEKVLDYEAYIQDIAVKAPEHKEGLAAFLEGRQPDYRKAIQ